MKCVVRNTVLPSAAGSSHLPRVRRAVGSKPVVGSSRKSSSGSPASATATSRRRCCRRRACSPACRLLLQADELDHLVDGRRVRVVAARTARRSPARSGTGRRPVDCSTMPIAALQLRLAFAGVVAEDVDLAGRRVAEALEDLRRWWSCPRRSGRAARRPRRARRAGRCRATASTSP